MLRFRSLWDECLVSLLALVCAMSPSVLRADVRLPSILGDHMVLQQSATVTLWGWAYSGEKVVVETSWGARAEAMADDRGEWHVAVATPQASPLASLRREWISFTVPKDENSIRLKDILIGEVWLASGQSNMCMMLGPDYPKGRNDWYGDKFWQEESAHLEHPAIRVFNVEKCAAPDPLADCKGVLPDHILPMVDKDGGSLNLLTGWQACTPASAPYMSAVAYYFAVKLQKKLDVPVGIVVSAVGGSRIEAWMSAGALRAVPGHANEPTKVHRMGSCALFNGMIAPLLPMTFRGVIWYQGESNVGAPDYARLFTAFLADWRARFGSPSLPFQIVQLANFGKPVTGTDESKVPFLREAQAQVADAVPGVGMAVAIDLGAPTIHPPNKRDVADRLSRLALRKTYGIPLDDQGPVFDSMHIDGSEIRVRFKNAEGLAVAGGGELGGFSLAGEDGKFLPAQARVDGPSVIVTNPKISAPLAVRYAWASNPVGCNLINKAGLPAAPFRSDDKPSSPSMR